jgi:hypothetical protein
MSAWRPACWRGRRSGGASTSLCAAPLAVRPPPVGGKLQAPASTGASLKSAGAAAGATTRQRVPAESTARSGEAAAAPRDGAQSAAGCGAPRPHSACGVSLRAKRRDKPAERGARESPRGQLPCERLSARLRARTRGAAQRPSSWCVRAAASVATTEALGGGATCARRAQTALRPRLPPRALRARQHAARARGSSAARLRPEPHARAVAAAGALVAYHPGKALATSKPRRGAASHALQRRAPDGRRRRTDV